MARRNTSSIKIVTVIIVALGLGPACDHHRTVPDDQALSDGPGVDMVQPDTAVADVAAPVPDMVITSDLPPPTGWIAQAGCKDKISKIWIWDTAADGAGNSFIAGRFEGTACIGASKFKAPGTLGANDSFVTKVDAKGTFTWATHIAGYNHVQVRAVALDKAGNAYVAGTFDAVLGFAGVTFGSITRYCGTDANPHNFCYFVGKLNPQGKFLWVTTGNTQYDGALPVDLAVDAKGNVHVAGQFRGTTTLGSFTLKAKSKTPYLDHFLGTLSPSGTWTQAVAPGFNNNFGLYSLAVDGTSNRYVLGNFSGTASFGSVVLSSKGDVDAFVGKLDAAGKVLWAVSAGGTGFEMAWNMTLDSAGCPLIVGYMASPATFGSIKLGVVGKNDAFVAKLSPAGKFLWATASSGAGGESARAIAVDASGNAYVTGIYKGVARFGSTSFSATKDSPDGFVARLDKNGKFTGAKTWGSQDADVASGIMLDKASSVYLAGTFKYKTAFGPHTLTNNSFWDLFVWKVPTF